MEMEEINETQKELVRNLLVALRLEFSSDADEWSSIGPFRPTLATRIWSDFTITSKLPNGRYELIGSSHFLSPDSNSLHFNDRKQSGPVVLY